MHKNKVWLGFLTAMALIAIWFVWGAAQEVYDYLRYNAKTEPLSIEWSVDKRGEEQFSHKARFEYKAAGDIYSREDILPVYYRNPWAAKEALSKVKEKNWDVWYVASRPSDAALQKEFPTKKVVSASILVGLVLYFFWLGIYVVKFKKDAP